MPVTREILILPILVFNNLIQKNLSNHNYILTSIIIEKIGLNIKMTLKIKNNHHALYHH